MIECANSFGFFPLFLSLDNGFGHAFDRGRLRPARGRGRPWSFCFWFSSLDSGFGPASGLGRLRGGAAGGRGLAAPSPPHPLPRLEPVIRDGDRVPSGVPCLPR